MDSGSWFYAVGKQRTGPVSLAELQQLAGGGTLAPDTLVWRPQADAWLPAAQVPELMAAFRGPRPASPESGAGAWSADAAPDGLAGAVREGPALPATPGDLRKLTYAFEHSGTAGVPRATAARPQVAGSRSGARGSGRRLLKWLAAIAALVLLAGAGRALVRAHLGAPLRSLVPARLGDPLRALVPAHLGDPLRALLRGRLGDPLRALPPAARAALDSAPAPRRQALAAGYRDMLAMTRTPAFQARFRDLPRDSGYAAGVRAATRGMKRLGPDDLGLYAQLVATIFQRSPGAPWCVPMLGTGTLDQGLATRAVLTLDSADIRLWFQLSRLALEAELAERPAPPVGEAEKQAAWNAMLDGMQPATRTQFVAQARAPIHDPATACWQGSALFGTLAALPPEQRATILRGLVADD